MIELISAAKANAIVPWQVINHLHQRSQQASQQKD